MLRASAKKPTAQKMADSGREGTEYESSALAKQTTSSAFSAVKSFVSGGFGGICCVLVGESRHRIAFRV